MASSTAVSAQPMRSVPGAALRFTPQLRFIAVKVVGAITLLLIVSLLSFVLISLAPGDPARQILGNDATPEAVSALRTKLGLDQPMIVQYLSWLVHALGGDLGQSIYSAEHVSALLGTRFEVTLSLVVLSLVVSLVIGVTFGFISAVRGGWAARVLDTIAMVGFAVPSFWFGIVLVSLFAVTLRMFPATGYVSFGTDPRQWALSLVLPVFALSVHSIAAFSKQTREVLLEILSTEYIRIAYANGISRRALLLKHAMKNAGIRIVAVLSVLTIGLMGGTVMVESVFSMPGLGGLAVEASMRKDLPVLQGVVVLFTVVVVVINLATDLINSWLNPKVVTR